MRRLLALIAASLGGWIGWWLGARVGMMTAFVLSVIGAGLGIYAAQRIAQHYLG
jgi:predicted esterase YcpF (UPF0227 family)